MPKQIRYRTVAKRVDGIFECGDANSESMSRIYALDAMQTKHGAIPGPGSGNGLLVPLADSVSFETFQI